ncbi:MAG: hypothetical protein K2X55_12060 [Burkholderiaceae bacterium]|nr:hypothetical protein [Burkholderiaceae bacterium]
MNLMEALLATGEQEDIPEDQRTTYWLGGGIIYPDELFSAQGFMPLLGRMAERKLARTLTSTEINCGFSYIPDRAGIFGECFMAAAPTGGVLEDGLRLAALCEAARDVLGMGTPGIIDITLVFEYFRAMPREQRADLKQAEDKELKQWPLYQQMQTKQAA